jgi:hypothetical protein
MGGNMGNLRTERPAVEEDAGGTRGASGTGVTVEVWREGDMDRAEREELDRWASALWPPDVDPYKWAPLEWRVVVRCDGELASQVAIVDRTITVGGSPLRVGGISTVITPLKWQRRGFATAALRRAQAFAREEFGVEFCMLVCEEDVVDVYRKAGWELLDAPVVFDQPPSEGKVVWPHLAMVIPTREGAWPAGPVDLCGLPW